MTDRNSTSPQRGFTLVELIAVIVLIGIVSAVAMPRFTSSSGFAERAYFEEVSSALRYSRAAALSTGCPVRFVLSAGAYDSSQQQPLGGRCNPADTGWGQALTVADGSPVAGSAPAGVSAAPASTIVFGPSGATDLASNLAIVVGGFSLTVHAASGYVEAP